MNIDDPVVLNVLRRSMVARIATLSRTGRPSINLLYFVYWNGRIWLGTSSWTRASRNVLGDPRVSILFQVEQDRSPHLVLRIRGQASVQTDQRVKRS
jgi:general stress protein 26